MASQTPYEILGVPEDCSKADIQKRYRELARKYHPDVNPDPNAQSKYDTIKASYDFLMEHHVEPASVQTAHKLEDIIKNAQNLVNKLRNPTGNSSGQPTEWVPKGMKKVRGVREQSLVSALKQWKTTNPGGKNPQP